MSFRKLIVRVLLLGVCLVSLLVSCSKQPSYLRVGAILPMTGNASGYGKWMHNGIELAVEDINRSGGVKGKQLTVVFEDSRSDNRSGVDAANKLISIDKVRIIETTLTGITESIVPITEQNRIILFTSATAPGLTLKGQYIFRNATNINNEIDRMIKACLHDLRISKVGVIYLNNSVGLWSADYFADSFHKQGGEVSGSESFQPDAAEFRTQLSKLIAVKPQAIYIFGYQQNGRIMKQARELGFMGQFLGVTDFELPDVLKVAGDAADGAIYTKAAFEPNSTTNIVNEFVSKYRNKYHEDPEVYAATMYDATMIIAIALANAAANPDSIRSYILSIKDYPGVSGQTTFLPNGDVVKPVSLKKISKDKYIEIG